MEQTDFMNIHNYKCWEIKHVEDFNWEKVNYKGNGYVIMEDKSRFDTERDLYREERLFWNSLKSENYLYIKIGRWLVTSEGIETKKVNNEPIIFDIKQIWSFEQKADYYVYSLPTHLCSKGWLSNVDLLDFNSAFLVCMELFENQKPNNFPKISWSQTLRRQYKRFQNSLDINSFEGKKQYEYQQEYFKTISFEDMIKIFKVDINSEFKQETEIFGDSLSRNP